MRLLLLLAVLCFALPAFAQEVPVSSGPRALILLPLPAVPDGTHSSRSMDEASMKTARGATPFLKIAPLAISIPTGVAGVSLAASVPIALSVGDTIGASAIRSAGLTLMGVSFGSTLAFNIVGRSLRMLIDVAPWSKDLGFFIAGVGMSVTGAVLVGLASGYAGIWSDPATGGVLASGATAWGIGMAFMIIDTVRIAWRDLDPAIASNGRPGTQVQFAGVWASPNLEGGASAGLSLRW